MRRIRVSTDIANIYTPWQFGTNILCCLFCGFRSNRDFFYRVIMQAITEMASATPLWVRAWANLEAGDPDFAAGF